VRQGAVGISPDARADAGIGPQAAARLIVGLALDAQAARSAAAGDHPRPPPVPAGSASDKMGTWVFV